MAGTVSEGGAAGGAAPPPGTTASAPQVEGQAVPTAGHATEPDVRLTAWVRGRVQGVGFRWWTRARALELGLVGWAANLKDGRVEVVAEGPRPACEALLARLRGSGTPGRVEGVTEMFAPAKGRLSTFVER